MSLFFINTPLQLINALEARSHFGIEQADIIIPLGAAWSVERFTPLLKLDSWRSIRFLEMTPRGGVARLFGESPSEQARNLYQMFRRVRLDSAARPYRGIGRLFVGNYRNDYQRHFANQVRPAELVLLDDGTDSILLAGELQTHAATPAGGRRRSTFGELRGGLRRVLIEWNSTVAARVTFFSSYDLTARPADVVIRNELRRIRRMLRAAEQTRDVFLLGQPLVEDGYLEAATYVKYVQHIRTHHAGRHIVYVAHPRESSAGLERIRSVTELEVRRLGQPIELELLTSQKRPAIVASFFCSALVNCQLLFGDLLRLEAWVVLQQDLLCAHASVAAVYDHFALAASGAIRMLSLERPHLGQDTSQ